MPQPGTKPATQACALTRNQAHNLLAHGTMLQPTEPYHILFISRGRGRGEKERERNINVRERHPLAASPMGPDGDQNCNLAMCPTGNQTGDLSLCGMVPNQLSHTSQGTKIGGLFIPFILACKLVRSFSAHLFFNNILPSAANSNEHTIFCFPIVAVSYTYITWPVFQVNCR